MKLVFFGSGGVGGSGGFGVRALAALADAGFAPALVVTQPPRRRSRGGGEEATPVHRAALSRSLELLCAENVNAEEALARLRAAKADLFVVAEYGQLLKAPLLAIPAKGSINLHSSLLPRHRGASPVVAALLAGDRETGVSVQRVVLRLDAGPVLASRSEAIVPGDDAGTLAGRLSALGATLLVEVVAAFARGEPPPAREQDEAKATFCRRLSPEDAWIDWAGPAGRIERQVRALRPKPLAQTAWLRDAPLALKILAAEPLPGHAAAGEVVAVGDAGIDVGTGEGLLRILELLPAGSRAMTAVAFRNGYRIAPGERLGRAAR